MEGREPVLDGCYTIMQLLCGVSRVSVKWIGSARIQSYLVTKFRA